MDIGDWLRTLGLERYEAAFRDNEIDDAVLPNLTAEDLKDLGVGIVGHRRKLLDAIAALRVNYNALASPLPAPPPTPPSAAATPSHEAAGERRYLTVLFCDLVGSTGISAQLDAEEWRDLVGGYLEAASAAVTEMGGHVAKKLGDGLLALFGYPAAQENDAERAVRAALAIQRSLAELNRKNDGTGKPALVARIAIDLGPAVVDATGEIFGDVPNIAARAQALAEPGSVVVTARVQRQVAGLFVAEERGSHQLKGVPESVALYRIVRASGGGRRSGARQLTPLVGRDEEMAMLARRWERARAGDGQLVLIVGEPGLGKSRLIEEFHPRLSDTPHTWVEWSCSQLLQNTPLHPIAEWGRQRFGGADVPAERRLADLESSLAQVKLNPAENAPLLAPLLDIPLPKDRALSLAPEELRRRQLAALTNWVMAGARAQPVVLAFEDLHWADPTTLDILRGIAERGALAPLYVVATTRPEFRPPWSMRSHHGTISLAPLDRAQVRDMVAELSARHALPKEVVDDVASRTGGVPLFVEEVTRLLLERGEQGGIQAIPPTLQQSLMARLDRLGPTREVAQIGSVIGRGFSYSLLRDVAGMEDVALQAALEKLAEADILLVQGAPPDSDYRFKHALIQDAAYENLLKSRRQVLHCRVAEILRDRFATTAAAEPEALAHHFTQAGMTDAAIEWWGKAGDQALRRSAFQEAISHLGKAIEMADKAGDGAARAAAPTDSGRLKLQTSYGRAVAFSRGFASEDTRAAFIRAKNLATEIDNPVERFPTYYGLWVGSLTRGEFGLAREIAETFKREAEDGSWTTEVGVASHHLGITCLFQGDLAAAQVNLNYVLSTYNPERDGEAKLRFGVDSRVAAALYLAGVSWLLGEAVQARELMEQAIARATQTAHVMTLTNARGFEAVFEILRGDAEAARRAAEACIELSREHNLTLYLAWGTVCLSWALSRLSKGDIGAEGLREALATYTGQGNIIFVPLFQGLLTELEAKSEGAERALTRIDGALTLANNTGEHWTDAFLQRIRGEILLKRDSANTAPAEEALLTAIAVAQQQKARSFELRAALSLAKLYQSTGRVADAHAVLAPALEGFSSTPEFPEIAEAQALLAALAKTGEVKKEAAQRQRRLKLQTSYGQALQWSKGYVAEEATAAFKRAQELAAGTDDDAERFRIHQGQFVASYMRAELRVAQEIAETMVRGGGTGKRVQEAAAAQSMLGLTLFMQGAFADASALLEEALSHHDRNAKIPVAIDTEVGAKVSLAYTFWVSGDFARARDLINESVARSVQIRDPPNQCTAYSFKSRFEMLRGDAEGAGRAAENLLEVSQEYETKLFLVSAEVYGSWARTRLHDRSASAKQFQQALVAYADQGNKIWLPLYQGRLAEIEADGEDIEEALARIDGALALAAETREHWSDSLLHRIRGEILLKRDPTDTATAEEAFLTAIAVAQQQKAKSFELRAALALAKLYQSTNRAADADAVLTPALAGFSPTPEFPEIEEARRLLAALAETDEVKNAAESRQRRLKLQTAYANALIHTRGHGALETSAAFAKAQTLAAGLGEAADRFSAYYGQWVGSLNRCEPATMQEAAAAFLRETELRPGSPEAGVAYRISGLTRLYFADYAGARANIEKALAILESERDRELAFRFGQDQVAAAMIYMALVLWPLGDVERARQFADQAASQAAKSGNLQTLAYVNYHLCLFEALRGDRERATPVAKAVLDLARERAMPIWESAGRLFHGWANWLVGDQQMELAEMRHGILRLRELGQAWHRPYLGALLAEAEASVGNLDIATGELDRLLAEAKSMDQHWSDAELHRIRGEILLKHDPANTAAAEEAFLAAIAIAQRQKARSFELRAAMSMARLWRDQGKREEAYDLLAPVYGWFTEGFDTRDLKEAEALLNELAA